MCVCGMVMSFKAATILILPEKLRKFFLYVDQKMNTLCFLLAFYNFFKAEKVQNAYFSSKWRQFKLPR